MALFNKIFISPRFSICGFVRTFNTSSTRLLDQKYRAKQQLTENPNHYGPLTNWPDYSYKDGRPTPLGVRQRTRLNKQKNYAERILKLTREVDYAVERHKQILAQKEKEKQMILDQKLKAKGNQLLLKED